jgi:hypothetical protein
VRYVNVSTGHTLSVLNCNTDTNQFYPIFSFPSESEQSGKTHEYTWLQSGLPLCLIIRAKHDSQLESVAEHVQLSKIKSRHKDATDPCFLVSRRDMIGVSVMMSA